MKKISKSGIAAIIALLSTMLPIASGATFAADIQWRKSSYSHYAQKEALKDLLVDFFSNQGIGTICSAEVNDKISGQFINEDSQRFFNKLIQAYDLIWYYDGAAVYIYSAHEMASRILNLGYLDMHTFEKNLKALGFFDERFGLKMVADERIVFISGPPRYVQLVSELAEKLDEKAMLNRGRNDIINVFPLKHAWADDKTLNFHDRELVIPGVATLLRNVITGQTSPGQVVGWKKRKQLLQSITKLKGEGLSRYRRKTKQVKDNYSPSTDEGQPNHRQADVDGENLEDADYEKQPPAYIDDDLGVIQADPRQNAVLVRDREEKMPYYEKIIALLDVPVGLVEIRATIIDVDRNNLEELGIQWQFKSTSSNNQSITSGSLNTYNAYSKEDGLQMPLGNGFNVATIIGDSRNFFIAQINALQEKGLAEILSRPSVLTMNNVEAQLEHSKTFYVRVQGTDEVDLFDVTAGVMLQVTPHIIEEEKRRRVKLAIQIKDGTFSDSDEEVDEIPVVQNSVINTQAIVGENESLLIGGYRRNQKSNKQYQVPCLGEIPLLGWLFKRRSSTDSNTERLFLITPTIVPYGNSDTLEKKLPPPSFSIEDLLD